MSQSRIDDLIAIIEARGGGRREERFEAVERLVEMGSPTRAAPAVVRLFAWTYSSWNAHERLGRQLATFGPAVLEPLLQQLEIGLDRETSFLGNACEALARLGVRDDRIFARINELYEHHDPVWGAKLFGIYGDPAAIPILATAIESFDPDPRYGDYLEDLDDFLEAHARCGGKLDARTASRLIDQQAEWRRARLKVVR